MQYMQYATIRPDALQNNLLQVQNEQVFDVSGRPQNPYQSQFLFAAAPVRSSSPTNTVTFVLRRNLYLTNSSVPTYAPQLDFGDGRGYQTVKWDQPISTTYATAGLKRIKVKLPFIYSNGTPESWFDFDVLSVVALARTTATSDLEQSFPGGATHSGGKAYVIFGNTGGVKHTQLTKPFIISEGYNLYDIAPELRKCNNPNNNIEEFFDKINKQFYSNSSNFRQTLLNAGYDIVYIDNAKGTDDITRNAQLFEAVVRWVNGNKAGGTSGERNVVMGQSMGGLVSRYGLAEMTKRGNDDPHTRLLVLHDSPQRGAYNPVGVQSLGRSFDVPFLFGNSLADLNGEIRATVRVLNQPATQQLSILNAFNGRSDIRANTFIPDTYQPMIAFSGQPPYDVVAVSNGSQCGRGQNTPVGVTITESSLAFLLPIGKQTQVGFTGNCAAYGLPALGQQTTVSRISLQLDYRIGIGICPVCTSIRIYFHLLQESAQSPPNTLPYETLPGGTTNPYQQAGSCGGGFDFGSLNGIYAAYLRTKLYNGDLCFVPSYSALDVPTVTPSTAFAKYINSATDNPSLPRVKRYLAQEQTSSALFNTAHISFTPRNSEWIFNEMQRPFNGDANPINCGSTECVLPADVTFTGPGTLCGTATYSTVDRGPGYTYTWTASPASLFTNPSGTGLTFTTGNNSPDDNGFITLEISGDCPRTVQRSIKVGRPAAPAFEQRDPGDMCYSGTAYYTLTNYDPALTYSIRAVGATGIMDPGGFRLKRSSSGYVSFTVTVTTGNCSSTADGEVTFDCTSAYTYSVYPNPANETTTVAADVPPGQRGVGAPRSFHATLHNAHGQPVQMQPSRNGAAPFDTRALPAGLYHLVIREGQHAERRNVSIQH